MRAARVPSARSVPISRVRSAAAISMVLAAARSTTPQSSPRLLGSGISVGPALTWHPYVKDCGSGPGLARPRQVREQENPP